MCFIATGHVLTQEWNSRGSGTESRWQSTAEVPGRHVKLATAESCIQHLESQWLFPPAFQPLPSQTCCRRSRKKNPERWNSHCNSSLYHGGPWPSPFSLFLRESGWKGWERIAATATCLDGQLSSLHLCKPFLWHNMFLQWPCSIGYIMCLLNCSDSVTLCLGQGKKHSF